MVLEKKLVTIAEFERFADAPENADRRFELIHGEIVEKSMPTQEHGVIALNLGSELRTFVKAHSLGRVAVEVRYHNPQDQHNARQPDVSFVADSSKPLVKQGSVPQMPDLAVEIKSPDDTYRELREKAAYYLANGSRMVWLVFPEKRLVEVYQPDADDQILTDDDTLEGGNVLPGFRLTVRSIFEDRNG